MTVFTETAIGGEEGMVQFHRDQDEQPGDNYYKAGHAPRAISASTVANWGWGSYDVRQVDLARWVLEHVSRRTLPAAPVALPGEAPPPPPFVLMKMDTEGAEHAVLPRLAFSGALCSVDLAAVEEHYGKAFRWPAENLVANVTALLTHAGCNTTLVSGDDESGGLLAKDVEVPLP